MDPTADIPTAISEGADTRATLSFISGKTAEDLDDAISSQIDTYFKAGSEWRLDTLNDKPDAVCDDAPADRGVLAQSLFSSIQYSSGGTPPIQLSGEGQSVTVGLRPDMSAAQYNLSEGAGMGYLFEVLRIASVPNSVAPITSTAGDRQDTLTNDNVVLDPGTRNDWTVRFSSPLGTVEMDIYSSGDGTKVGSVVVPLVADIVLPLDV